MQWLDDYFEVSKRKSTVASEVNALIPVDIYLLLDPRWVGHICDDVSYFVLEPEDFIRCRHSCYGFICSFFHFFFRVVCLFAHFSRSFKYTIVIVIN